MADEPSLRLHGESKYSELLSNTGFYPHGHETILATIAAHADHASADPMRVHLQALQIAAETARRQATIRFATYIIRVQDDPTASIAFGYLPALRARA